MGPFLVRKPDVIYVYHPPITIGLPAMILRALRAGPFVYDVQTSGRHRGRLRHG